MSQLYYPLNSLRKGNWFKLICGASFQHLPAVRSLALAYTLAGADCIDVAADAAVILAAQEGIKAGQRLAEKRPEEFALPSSPFLMVSWNDGEDPHFRKAEFDPKLCPRDCPRPCEKICPAAAIAFQDTGGNFSGIDLQRCYGCGRCLPICPSQLISTRSCISGPEALVTLMAKGDIDALEIHTHVGNFLAFQRLWQAISPNLSQLKLLAISCPDHPDLSQYLHSLYELIFPLPCPLVWQADGRPMSGDIGLGTTHATIRLAQKILAAGLPGYVQLAGGTNQYTVTKLKKEGLLSGNLSKHSSSVAGIAYGSYARSLLSPILKQLETVNYSTIQENIASSQDSILLEDCPHLLSAAVTQAQKLVEQLKRENLSSLSLING